MVALFAAGVVTGTILSFEMGLLWPNFTATFGGVFGLGFAVEGFSFFMEAIFIGIYVYGWDRMSPRAHFASGIPIMLTGFTGSLTVIAVNGWMNHPTGFVMSHGRVTDIHPVKALFANSYFWHELVHMYLAGYMVTGFLVAGAYAFARLRGRWSRYERIALAIPLTLAVLASVAQIFVGDWNGREVAASQPVKLAAFEGLAHTTKGAPIHLLGWYRNGKIEYGIPIPGCSPACVPQHDRHRGRARCRTSRRSAARQRRANRIPDDGRNRRAARRCSRSCRSSFAYAGAACPSRSGSTEPSSSPGRWRSSP